MEQYILMNFIECYLELKGVDVKMLENLGLIILFDVLVFEEIDFYVDYIGIIWVIIMKCIDVVDCFIIYIEVFKYFMDIYKIVVIGCLGFENVYGFVMCWD